MEINILRILLNVVKNDLEAIQRINGTTPNRLESAHIQSLINHAIHALEDLKTEINQ